MSEAWYIAYFSLRVLSSATMIALDAWCLVAVYRVMWSRKQAGFYDPMRAVMAWPTTNTIWYQARTWVFGQHLNSWVPSEFAWYFAAAICTIVGAHLVYVTIRNYECAAGDAP